MTPMGVWTAALSRRFGFLFLESSITNEPKRFPLQKDGKETPSITKAAKPHSGVKAPQSKASFAGLHCHPYISSISPSILG
jgi:hypothetical protein